jgi:hypothetical protein
MPHLGGMELEATLHFQRRNYRSRTRANSHMFNRLFELRVFAVFLRRRASVRHNRHLSSESVIIIATRRTDNLRSDHCRSTEEKKSWREVAGYTGTSLAIQRSR